MTFVFWGILIVSSVVAFLFDEYKQDVDDAHETINILINKYGMTRDEAIVEFNKYNGEM